MNYSHLLFRTFNPRTNKRLNHSSPESQKQPDQQPPEESRAGARVPYSLTSYRLPCNSPHPHIKLKARGGVRGRFQPCYNRASFHTHQRTNKSIASHVGEGENQALACVCHAKRWLNKLGSLHPLTPNHMRHLGI